MKRPKRPSNHNKATALSFNYDKETIIKEIEKANNDFLENLGFVPDIFAYPYGEYNYEIKQITKEYFKAAFGQQSGNIYNGIDIFELPRYS